MKRSSLAVLVLAMATAGLNLSAASGQETAKSENVVPLAHVEYKGGSHLTFGGGYAYGGEINGESGRDQAGFEDKGGIRIFDITGTYRQAGFFHCPGNDLDVAFMKPGLIAVGYHKAVCTEAGEGVFTLDVRNPAKPRLLGFVTFPAVVGRNHAMARYPGKQLLYTAGGGIGRGQETIHMVDVSDPAKPEIAGTFLAPPRGCHDISFHFDKRGKFAFCAGLGDVQIWDVADPLQPTVITHITNPLIQFPHYAVASKDGKLLVINDEAVAANECVEQEAPAGAIWVYDISDMESPTPVSYFSPPRGANGPVGSFFVPATNGTCTSHDFNFIDKRTVVIPWYKGGFNVISLKDPANPEEIAFYQPEGTDMWSAHWYKGLIYTSDMGRGFEVVDIKGQ